MKHSFWLVILVLVVVVQSCGSQKPEKKPDQTAFWMGEWTINARSIEKARISTVGMSFLKDGSYQNGSFNKGKFYPMSKNGKWGLIDNTLLIIDGRHTNRASYTILSNNQVQLDFKSSKMFLYKLKKIEQ